MVGQETFRHNGAEAVKAAEATKAIELRENPLKTREVEVDNVHFTIAHPGRIDDWQHPQGFSGQQIPLGEGYVELSYILGAKEGKPSTGDNITVVCGHSEQTGNRTVIIYLEDYLSHHPDTLKDWHALTGGLFDNTILQGMPIVPPDVAGANDMRHFMATTRGFHLMNTAAAVLNLNPRLLSTPTLIEAPPHHFLTLEGYAKIIAQSWLNQVNLDKWHRSERLFERIKKELHLDTDEVIKWRNYWMNAVISTVCIAQTPGGPTAYAWIRSNADTQLQAGPLAATEYRYHLHPTSHERIGTLPVDADINRLVDRIAEQQTGVTAERTYHEKTAPSGAFMVYGPPSHRGASWLQLALTRADHGEYSTLETPVIISVATDGACNPGRDFSRSEEKARLAFNESSAALCELGGEGLLYVLGSIIDYGIPDDYAHLIAQLI